MTEAGTGDPQTSPQDGRVVVLFSFGMPRWFCRVFLTPEILRNWPPIYGESLDTFMLETAQQELSPECRRVTSVHVKVTEELDAPNDAVCIVAYGETE